MKKEIITAVLILAAVLLIIWYSKYKEKQFADMVQNALTVESQRY